MTTFTIQEAKHLIYHKKGNGRKKTTINITIELNEGVMHTGGLLSVLWAALTVGKARDNITIVRDEVTTGHENNQSWTDTCHECEVDTVR